MALSGAIIFGEFIGKLDVRKDEGAQLE